ncbi:tetratricopeptide repeat-containing sensor histidine kinase [Ekhidna sp.]|uniref:tetratricopeptide repeat-containing sensor histidine kinase n=1 Tax=Ekhidna sp. TaxID=2608089 RepID=UPI003B50C587
MKPITYLIALLLFSSLFSQRHVIDSIKNELSTQEPTEQIQSLNDLSWHYKNIDTDSAMQFAQNALELSKKIESSEAIAASYNSIANVLEATGKLDSALQMHKMSLSIKENLQDTSGMADSYNNIGIAYDELGKYNLALEYYLKALRLYESQTDQDFKIAMVLGNIGIVYKKQKEYDKVLSYYQQALAIYEEVKSDFGIMVTKGNIGSVMLHTGDYEQSIQYSEDAMKSYKENGYMRYVPYMKSNIAIAYDSLREWHKARSYYLEAINEHKDFDNDYELSSTYVFLAANYWKTQEYQKSAIAAQKGYDLAKKINALEFQSTALMHWSKALAGMKKYSEAFNKLMQHNIVKDSLFEETKTKQIFELQTKYETEKKEQQIALQDAQIAEQDAQLERNQILLAASAVAIILIIAIALLQRSRLRKKQLLRLQEEQLRTRDAEINATITSQEKERARYARDLHDGFGQMISILNMNIQNLKEGAKPDERQKVFEESSKVIDDMYNELKNICFDLMPQTLIKSGLEAALNEFTSRINKAGKISIELNVFGLDQRLTELQEISLYRISQEWINNILKYSDASKVTLQITKDEQEITLLMEDDGTGFDRELLSNGKGYGWKNLNSRANLIRGLIELETHKGVKGNTLILNAPATPFANEEVDQNTMELV